MHASETEKDIYERSYEIKEFLGDDDGTDGMRWRKLTVQAAA